MVRPRSSGIDCVPSSHRPTGAIPVSSGDPKPCILITNDDGYDAPGIRALAEAMSALGDVVVAAPDTEQSASGHSLTLKRPLRIIRVDENRYRVDGTPTDCVHLAVPRLTGGKLPDLVVSGINRGLTATSTPVVVRTR